jgi:hypothetical protein
VPRLGSGEGPEPGSAFAYLIDTAGDTDSPPDLSERPDHYLYGSGYQEWRGREPKTAGPGKRAKKAK